MHKNTKQTIKPTKPNLLKPINNKPRVTVPNNLSNKRSDILQQNGKETKHTIIRLLDQLRKPVLFVYATYGGS